MTLVRLDTLQQFAAVKVTSDPGATGGPVIVPSCAQIVIGWVTPANTIAHNVLFGRYAGAFAGTAAQADAIKAGLTAGATWTALAAFMSPASNLFQVTIRNVDTEDQPVIPSTTPGAAGTGPGAALPAEIAVCVTLKTAFTGRSNRGRMFIPNWTIDAAATGNVIAPGAVTALGNWATSNIRSALSSQGYTLVIGQKARLAYTGSTGTLHPARPAGSVEVTSLTVRDNHWDSQRKRGLA